MNGNFQLQLPAPTSTPTPTLRFEPTTDTRQHDFHIYFSISFELSLYVHQPLLAALIDRIPLAILDPGRRGLTLTRALGKGAEEPKG